MAKSAVQDLVSQYSFEFCRLQGIDEGGIINDAPPIRRHRGHGPRHELQTKTQSPEEWLVQEKLGSSARQLLLEVVCLAHFDSLHWRLRLRGRKHPLLSRRRLPLVPLCSFIGLAADSAMLFGDIPPHASTVTKSHR